MPTQSLHSLRLHKSLSMWIHSSLKLPYMSVWSCGQPAACFQALNETVSLRLWFLKQGCFWSWVKLQIWSVLERATMALPTVSLKGEPQTHYKQHCTKASFQNLEVSFRNLVQNLEISFQNLEFSFQNSFQNLEISFQNQEDSFQNLESRVGSHTTRPLVWVFIGC